MCECNDVYFPPLNLFFALITYIIITFTHIKFHSIPTTTWCIVYMRSWPCHLLVSHFFVGLTKLFNTLRTG